MNGGGMFRCRRRIQRLEKPQSAMGRHHGRGRNLCRGEGTAAMMGTKLRPSLPRSICRWRSWSRKIIFSGCAGYIAHPFSKDTVFTSNFAGVIRLFPPSYWGLIAHRKAMVVQITTDFLPVPQVPSAFCPGVTGFLQLCF